MGSRANADAIFADEEFEHLLQQTKFQTIPTEEMSPEMRDLMREKAAKDARKAKKAKSIPASKFDLALKEVDVMIASGDWDAAKYTHLIAYYDRMHTRCYGVEPLELDAKGRYFALMQVSKFVKDEFGSDIGETVDFAQWVWTREIKKEKWRRENGIETSFRFGVRFAFSKKLLTDYRLYLAQNSHKT